VTKLTKGKKNTALTRREKHNKRQKLSKRKKKALRKRQKRK